ncbi:MAG: DUF6514 family protein [Anaerocolumna sp.]
MEKLYLEGTKLIAMEDEKEVKFDYYLVEDNKGCEKNIMLYGIKIVQHMENHLVAEYSDPISYSKDLVQGMVHKLCNNEVTLASMLEIVDDLVTECLA